MYKNTKSTSRVSVLRKTHSTEAYLEKLYEHSKTIFVGRGIVSLKLFGELPTASPISLIKDNKKYLSKVGYLETQIEQMPNWFLFHPKISMLIRCLRDIAQTQNRNKIPFELELIAFREPPNQNTAINTTRNNNVSMNRINGKYNSSPRVIQTPFEYAFEKVKNLK